MAARTDAQEERIATLRSVMNVIALLDAEAPRRRTMPEAIDLRALLPLAFELDPGEDPWAESLAQSRLQH